MQWKSDPLVCIAVRPQEWMKWHRTIARIASEAFTKWLLTCPGQTTIIWGHVVWGHIIPV